MGKITDALRKAAQDRSDRTTEEIRIHEQDQIAVKKMEDSKVDSRLVAYFDPKAVISEQYKILTTNVLSLNKTKPYRSLVITSSTHSEGKTVTALNLAITMSRAVSKPKILLIDADMRRGRLAKYLGIEQQTGLSELLEGKVPLGDVLFNLDIENLTFMSAGSVPEHPAELLNSDNMRKLLARVKKEFDFVLIDTPPVISVTDPGIVGNMADGVLMVVQAGRTQRGIVHRANELLQQAHAKVVGHILTNIEYFLPEYIYRYL